MSKKIALVFGNSAGVLAGSVMQLAESGYHVAYAYGSTPPSVPDRMGDSTIKGYCVSSYRPEQVNQVFSHVLRDFGALPTCVVAKPQPERAV